MHLIRVNTKFKFLGDMLLNIIASGMPIALLNLLVYPMIAGQVGATTYGTLTVCVGVQNFVNGIWGSSVAYTRLLHLKKEEEGSFSLLFLINLSGGLIMNIFMLWLTGCLKEGINVPLLLLSEIFLIANNYLAVEYRLKLSYVKIFMTNACGCIGYLLGYVMLSAMNFQCWEIVFVTGYGASFIYNLCSTSIWQQKLMITPGFKLLLKNTNVLVTTSTISGVSTYLDKFVIYPYLGAESMTYYQTASIMSKIIPMLATSISNVILSYLVKISVLSRKILSVCIIALSCVCVIGYYVCGLIVPVVIQVLYPSFYEKCMDIIPYANMIAMLQMFYTFIVPLTLRYAERRMQYYIQIGRLVPYLLFTVLLIGKYSLTGFCYATIISLLVQNLIVLLICFKTIEGGGSVGSFSDD